MLVNKGIIGVYKCCNRGIREDNRDKKGYMGSNMGYTGKRYKGIGVYRDINPLPIPFNVLLVELKRSPLAFRWLK